MFFAREYNQPGMRTSTKLLDSSVKTFVHSSSQGNGGCQLIVCSGTNHVIDILQLGIMCIMCAVSVSKKHGVLFRMQIEMQSLTRAPKMPDETHHRSILLPISPRVVGQGKLIA